VVVVVDMPGCGSDSDWTAPVLNREGLLQWNNMDNGDEKKVGILYHFKSIRPRHGIFFGFSKVVN